MLKLKLSIILILMIFFLGGCVGKVSQKEAMISINSISLSKTEILSDGKDYALVQGEYTVNGTKYNLDSLGDENKQEIDVLLNNEKIGTLLSTGGKITLTQEGVYSVALEYKGNIKRASTELTGAMITIGHSILYTADKTIVTLYGYIFSSGSTIPFSAYSGRIEIFINNTYYMDYKDIPNGKITFTEPGMYNIRAKVRGSSSNTIAVEVKSTGTLVLESDKTEIYSNNRDKVTFNMEFRDRNGNNLNVSGIKFFKDGVRYNDTQFSSSIPGVYKFHATYTTGYGDEVTSVTIEIIVKPVQLATSIVLTANKTEVLADRQDFVVYNARILDQSGNDMNTGYKNVKVWAMRELNGTIVYDWVVKGQNSLSSSFYGIGGGITKVKYTCEDENGTLLTSNIVEVKWIEVLVPSVIEASISKDLVIADGTDSAIITYTVKDQYGADVNFQNCKVTAYNRDNVGRDIEVNTISNSAIFLSDIADVFRVKVSLQKQIGGINIDISDEVNIRAEEIIRTTTFDAQNTLVFSEEYLYTEGKLSGSKKTGPSLQRAIEKQYINKYELSKLIEKTVLTKQYRVESGATTESAVYITSSSIKYTYNSRNQVEKEEETDASGRKLLTVIREYIDSKISKITTYDRDGRFLVEEVYEYIGENAYAEKIIVKHCNGDILTVKLLYDSLNRITGTETLDRYNEIIQTHKLEYGVY